MSGKSKKSAENSKVADVCEITVFWTEVMRDEQSELKDKLKVSELLAKVQGAFSDDKNSGENEQSPFSAMSLEEKLEFMENYVKEHR